jgi:aryl-alcohol dehydrogenase-like predicted oxidoreductase
MTASLNNVARVGLGTYRGNDDAGTDEIMCEIVKLAFRLGIRVVDTAVNYRCGRSEAVIGRALMLSIKEKILRRDDAIICTKGGFTRPNGSNFTVMSPPERHNPLDHCFRPACLRYQLNLSLTTLGLDKIDVYYLHNPEKQCERSSREEFQRTMRAAFEVLEEAVAGGLVGAYGVATWTGAGADQRLSLESLKTLAREVAAAHGVEDHFSFVQAPLSISRQQALIPCHVFHGEQVSFLKISNALGLTFIASSAADAGRVPAIAATSVGWVRSVPDVNTALVGTLEPDHLKALLR